MSGVTRDVSERRRSEAERARIQSELVQAQKMEIVGRLAAGMAHDINNQLTVIVAGAEALDDPRLRADAQKDILDAAQHAAAMTRQLQVFSRRRAVSLAPCDLNPLVARLERTLQRLVGVDVELSVRVLPRAIVRVDAAQIEQVLLNLAVNARDAMPSGGRLSVSVAESPSGVPPAWILRIADTGSGIDAPTLERIFEPFFTTKPEGRGTGLGLSIVRRIVEEAGGSVRVESEPGRGSSFSVSLPRWEGPAAEARGVAPCSASAHARRGDGGRRLGGSAAPPGVRALAQRVPRDSSRDAGDRARGGCDSTRARPDRDRRRDARAERAGAGGRTAPPAPRAARALRLRERGRGLRRRERLARAFPSQAVLDARARARGARVSRRARRGSGRWRLTRR